MNDSAILAHPGWAGAGETRARGQAFDASGRLLRGSDLAALFDSSPTAEGWMSIARALNGCFAAARPGRDELLAIVDRLRTIPMFVGRHSDGRWMVSDSAEAVRVALEVALPARDEGTALEFLLTGYVTGAQTLYREIQQLRAGHVFRAATGNGEAVQHEYYAFRHLDVSDAGEASLAARLPDLHQRVFKRLLSDVGDRMIVVPLSGGFDSRLIGCALRDLGHRNVLCYSYGAAGNWESAISQELARYLGFNWTMVPYTTGGWAALRGDREFGEYFRSAGNLAAVPHIQDWPAVRELRDSGQLSHDAVFVPGHSGDFLAGSHVPRTFPDRARLSREEILESIFGVHYSLWDWTGDPARLREQLAKRVEAVVGPIVDGSPGYAADVFENWDCQERQAKFIVNSVRVYESFGYEWRLPLFDAELMDFWSRVPVDMRVGRKLYFEFVRLHQQLPIREANTDHSLPVRTAIGLINGLGLRPLAKRVQRSLRRHRWREQYEGSDMRWFALIEEDEFRRRYTGREIGHSFFARRYLDMLAS